MTQFETIMFLKSPTPSVPIFIAASAERCEVVVFVYTLEACDNNYVVAVNLGT